MPQSPSDEMRAQLHSRYSSHDDLLVARSERSSRHVRISARVGRAAGLVKPGPFARDALLVEEVILELMDAYLARFGLIAWTPDMQDSPYSIFNSALRIIAIDTFRQAMSAHAYRFLGAKMEYAMDTLLIMRFFDHFVFHHMKARFTWELKYGSGAMEFVDKRKVTLERRRTVSLYVRDPNCTNTGCTQLADKRKKAIIQHGWSKRYLPLITTKATSDDEEIPPKSGIFVTKKKYGRSAEMEEMVVALDQKREMMVSLTQNARWQERKRVRPTENQPPSSFPRIPYDVPLDYYDPAFFNELPAGTRRKIIASTAPRIALPPRGMPLFASKDPVARLGHDQFMARYGNDLLNSYDLPSSDEDSDSTSDGSDDDGDAPRPEPVDNDDTAMDGLAAVDADVNEVRQREELARKMDV
jgi:hypothetical protein